MTARLLSVVEPGVKTKLALVSPVLSTLKVIVARESRPVKESESELEIAEMTIFPVALSIEVVA